MKFISLTFLTVLNVSLLLSAAILSAQDVPGTSSAEVDKERIVDVVKVKSDFIEAKLGQETLGYLEKGTLLRPRKRQDGFFLVEVHVQGRFRSLAWIDASQVESYSIPESELPQKPGYAYPDMQSLAKKEKKPTPLEQYVVTGYYSSEDSGSQSTEHDTIEKREAAGKDHTLVEEYRQFVGESSAYGKAKVGLDALPENLEVDLGVAPENKPEDGIVASVTLPPAPKEKRTEQTLGRSVAEFEITTEQIVALVLMLLLFVGVFFYFLYLASQAKKKKSRLG